MPNTQPITLPPRAAAILKTLQEAGVEAFVVGGCVRDSLIGRVPGDWDITTSARPEEVKRLFRRTVDTGLQHGTVTVMQGKEAYEVTTYRTDGAYSDGRHPDSVRFVSSLAEDLARRDFTINAMAYAPETGVVDLFGGLQDLDARLIRAVGDPAERFTEDALRMLRAVRFSAQLGFGIEPQTFDAIRPLAPRLDMVSRERIRDELNKLLLSDHPDHFEKLAECGITAVIMPRFDEMLATPQYSRFHRYDVGRHTLAVMKAAPPELPLRLCALLHDTGKVPARTLDAAGGDHFKGHQILSAVFAEQFLKEFRYDNKTADYVLRLIRVHDIRIPPTLPNVRRLLGRIGRDLFPDYLAFSLADAAGKSSYSQEKFAPHYRDTEAAYRRILEAGDPVTVGELAVGGADLIAAGVKPGPAMGEILRRMLEDVQREPSHNTAAYLLQAYLGAEGKPAGAVSDLPEETLRSFQRTLSLIRTHDLIILPFSTEADEDIFRAHERLRRLLRAHVPERSVYAPGRPAERFRPLAPDPPVTVADDLFPLALCLITGSSPETASDPRWRTAGAVARFGSAAEVEAFAAFCGWEITE